MPTNFKEPPILDDVTLNTLNSLKKTYTVQRDNTLKRAQSKIRDALGPLSRLWAEFEEHDTSKPMKINMKETRLLFEKSTILMGQAVVSLNHTRRKNILANLTDEKTAKELLKNNKEVFQREHHYSNDLLPEEFRDKLQDTNKAVGQVMRNLKISRGRQPFQRGSPHSATVGRGHNQNVQQNQNRRGGGNSNNPPQRGKNETVVIATSYPTLKTSSHSSYPERYPTRTDYPLKTGGSVEIFFESVEDHNKRSGNPQADQRLGHSFHRNASGIPQPEFIHIEGQPHSDRQRDLRDAGKRSHSEDLIRTRSGLIQLVPSREEGWHSETNIKPEKAKSEHSILTFQDGEFERCEKHHSRRGLDGENRHERCLFHSPLEPEITKVCEIQMEKSNLQVSLPMLRNRTSAKVVYKTAESADVSTSEIKHTPSDLSGRHIDFRIIEGRNRDGKGHHSIPSGELRIHSKSQEVRAEPIPDNGIFGGSHRQLEDDNVIDREENKLSLKTVHRNPEQGLLLHKGTEQSAGETHIHSSSGDSLYATSETLTATANTRPENKRILWLSNNLRQKFQIRTHVVDRKPTLENRETHTDILSRPNHLLRRSHVRGMGSLLSRPEDRGAVDTAGKMSVWGSDKYAGTNGSRFSNPYLCHTTPQGKEHSSHDRQQDSISLSPKNGGHHQYSTDGKNKIHMGIPALKGAEFDSRVPSNRSEHRGGLRVTPRARLDGMETLSIGLPESVSTVWPATHRPLCIQGITPNPTVHESKTRPTLHSSRRNATGLDPLLPLRIPSVQSNRESVKESSETSNRHDSHSSSLDHSALVPSTFNHGHRLSITDSEQKTVTERSSGESTPPNLKPIPKPKCLDDIREEMAGGRVSDRVKSLLEESRSVGTRANYNSAWKKFSSWCDKREINPVHCPVSDIMEYLAAMFDEGREHSTINGARSAISAYHVHVNNKPVGEHPLICSLIKGVSNKRPPSPDIVAPGTLTQC